MSDRHRETYVYFNLIPSKFDFVNPVVSMSEERVLTPALIVHVILVSVFLQ